MQYFFEGIIISQNIWKLTTIELKIICFFSLKKELISGNVIATSSNT